jgi:hypothetical protein
VEAVEEVADDGDRRVDRLVRQVAARVEPLQQQ